MKISEYIHRMYTKGRFVCLELEHGYALRAEEAIVKQDLTLLSEPLMTPYHRTPYIYSGEEVECVCCKLGITLLVKRVISVMEKLLVAGQVQDMVCKVTTDSKEQNELLARIAFAIDRCNSCFLEENLGMLRKEEVYEKMLEAGILGLLHVMMDN